jgi:hypothetical protein
MANNVIRFGKTTGYFYCNAMRRKPDGRSMALASWINEYIENQLERIFARIYLQYRAADHSIPITINIIGANVIELPRAESGRNRVVMNLVPIRGANDENVVADSCWTHCFGIVICRFLYKFCIRVRRIVGRREESPSSCCS